MLIDRTICPGCRYDLRGVPVVDAQITCPECGAVSSADVGPRPPIGRWKYYGIAMGVPLLVMFLSVGFSFLGSPQLTEIVAWLAAGPCVLAPFAAGILLHRELRKRQEPAMRQPMYLFFTGLGVNVLSSGCFLMWLVMAAFRGM